MKRIACMLVLGCAGSGFCYGQAQDSAPNKPAPEPMPDLGRLFQLPTTPQNGTKNFKLQIPGNGLQAFVLPEATVTESPRQAAPGDPGMVRKPQGFVERKGRPAGPRNIYPDLKVLPIEMAKLETPGSPENQFRMEPIPRVWPKARVEPIPTTWQGYRMVPVTTAAGRKTPVK